MDLRRGVPAIPSNRTRDRPCWRDAGCSCGWITRLPATSVIVDFSGYSQREIGPIWKTVLESPTGHSILIPSPIFYEQAHRKEISRQEVRQGPGRRCTGCSGRSGCQQFSEAAQCDVAGFGGQGRGGRRGVDRSRQDARLHRQGRGQRREVRWRGLVLVQPARRHRHHRRRHQEARREDSVARVRGGHGGGSGVVRWLGHGRYHAARQLGVRGA